MSDFLKKCKFHFLPACVIVAVSLIINFPYLREHPVYIHSWTQSDNYSLSIGFTHNGGDLFHPQTLIYNKQQKDFDGPVSLVTACDLPLHHWLVSILMRITGSHRPWVFRITSLAVSIAGIMALYLLTYVLTSSRAKGLLVATFTTTAPSYAYYSAAFLPTLPALSLAMGGLLLYVLHLRDAKTWTLPASILLLTLAMMTRTSFAVLWIAVACFQFLRIIKQEDTLKSSWIPFTAGVALFAAWWLWSLHLRHQYGSLFLGSILPVKNMEEARIMMQNVHDRWRFHYFQQMQHWLYVAVFVAAITTMIIGKGKRQATGRLSLWWFIAIWLFGELLFGAAMSRQYIDHDYYFLDSFFLPIVFAMVAMLAILPNPEKRWQKVSLLFLVLIITGFMTNGACRMQKVRRLEGVETMATAQRYEKANRMLDEAGLGSRDLKFLTLFSYPQNLPFTLMDREGYSVMKPKPEVVAHALTFDFDYILVEDEVYRREFDEAPYVLSRLQRLYGNGELSVCTLSDSVLHTTADHFFE